MPSPGEKVSPKVTDEEGIDKPIILDWLIISVFQNKKTKPPFIKSDFVFSLTPVQNAREFYHAMDYFTTSEP